MRGFPTSPPVHPEYSTLKSLISACAKAQEQDNLIHTLELMEQALVLRHQIYGGQSPQVQNACKEIGHVCNKLSLQLLQDGKFSFSLELLKKANILAENDKVLKAVTYNNFACYYRRTGKLKKALRYLSLALELENTMREKVKSRADTHLNLSAVLSEMGRHQNALVHAQSALLLLCDELEHVSSVARKDVSADRLAVLGIAYHNVGTEQEFLKMYALSEKTYRKGLKVSRKLLGESHSVVMRLKESLECLRGSNDNARLPSGSQASIDLE